MNALRQFTTIVRLKIDVNHFHFRFIIRVIVARNRLQHTPRAMRGADYRNTLQTRYHLIAAMFRPTSLQGQCHVPKLTQLMKLKTIYNNISKLDRLLSIGHQFLSHIGHLRAKLGPGTLRSGILIDTPLSHVCADVPRG
jgi:hypothetical protein